MTRFVSLLLAFLSLTALPAVAHATTFGAEVAGDFTNQARGLWTADQTLASLTKLYVAGGRVGRADSDWAGAEPHAPVRGVHTYNWAYDDMIAAEMAEAHLRWQPDLQYAPRWAEQHKSNVIHLPTGRFVVPLPPAKNATFATYATAFERRYGPRGSFWKANPRLPYLPVSTLEVWNEPDNKHNWGPDISLQDYARMYEAVRAAIHRVDRHAEVVTGGLAWTTSSLPRLLKAFKGKPIDAVAFHPYAATPTASINLARFTTAQMRQYGRARTPLLANEFGWTSTRGTWGSTKRANVSRYGYQTLIGLARLRVAYVLPFGWTDPTWGLADGTYARALQAVNHR
ncbi:MAG: hypothetical protein ACJ780_17890 [Solirubrobacteraceae bacterium]